MRGNMSSGLPLEDSVPTLGPFGSLPAPLAGDGSHQQVGSGTGSLGSLQGTVRALLGGQASAAAHADKEEEAQQLSLRVLTTRSSFQEVSLSDSPRAMSFTAISRNSAQNIPSGAASAFPSPSRVAATGSLARLSPIPKPKRAPLGAPTPPLAPVASTSTSNGDGPVPPASSFGAQPCESAALGTFRAGGPLREAPPPALLPQHHVRSSSAGSRQEALGGRGGELSFDLGPASTSAASAAADPSEKTGLLTNHGEPSSSNPQQSAAGPARGSGLKGGPHVDKAAGRSGCAACCSDALLVATLVGVVVGIVGGVLLRRAELSVEQIGLLGFAGEIMLRLLKMLVLPLVAGSMVAGVCSLRGSAASMARVARYTLAYYAISTATAVALGVLLVNLIQPGRGHPLAGSAVSSCRSAGLPAKEEDMPRDGSPLQALLGIARQALPDNVVAAAVDMNILGVITVSLFFGACLASLGERADALTRLVHTFNAVIGKMVGVVLWTSPVGIASLIAAAICRACSLLGTLSALGLWVFTVLAGLALFGGLLLPLAFWALTRRRALDVVRGFSRTLVLAFGTSSSSAALPVAMECAAEMGCAESVLRFVLPLGTTVNMNGTALYEATTVIFLAQAHGVALGLGGTIVVAVTATLAAIGAAAIPSAGLVTMLMVLQAVSLDRFAGDLAIILALDWLLDRCRTVVNLLGDSFGVMLIDHLCSQHDAPSGGSAQPYASLEMT